MSIFNSPWMRDGLTSTRKVAEETNDRPAETPGMRQESGGQQFQMPQTSMGLFGNMQQQNPGGQQMPQASMFGQMQRQQPFQQLQNQQTSQMPMQEIPKMAPMWQNRIPQQQSPFMGNIGRMNGMFGQMNPAFRTFDAEQNQGQMQQMNPYLQMMQQLGGYRGTY